MKKDNAIDDLIVAIDSCATLTRGTPRVISLLEIVRDQGVVLVPREFVRTFNKMIQLIEEEFSEK